MNRGPGIHTARVAFIAVSIAFLLLPVAPIAVRASSLPSGQSQTSAPRAMTQTGASPAQVSSQAGSAWIPAGPFGISTTSGVFNWDTGPDAGRVNAIAVDPHNPSTIYVGAAGGGVWKSTNGGSSWSPLTDGMPDLAVSVITIGPSGIIYVGTGDSDGAAGGGLAKHGDGLYVSSNGGLSWSILGADVFGTSTISGIQINPANPNEIMVSTGIGSCCKYKSFDANDNVGIFLSEDGGSTWTQQLSSSDVLTGISDMVSVPVQYLGTSFQVLYAGDFDSNVWGYNEPNAPDWAGGYWTAYPVTSLQGCTQAVRNCRVALSSSAAAPNWLYAAVGGTDGQVYGIGAINVVSGAVDNFLIPQNTTNTANPFGTETVQPCGEGQSFYDLVITADPTDGNRVYFGCSEVFRTDDAGGSWVNLGGYTDGSTIHPDIHAIVVAPDGSVYVGSDGGIYRSVNQGASWSSLNRGLQITQFYAVSVDPSGEILGASQDNGCEATFDGGANWQIINTGDGVWVGTGRSDPNLLMCEYPLAQFEVSLDGGASNMQVRVSGLPNTITQNANFITPMAQDPLHPGTLLVGADGIYATTDYGQNWFLAGGPFTGTTVTSIAVAPTNDSYVYFGSMQGGGFMTSDGGATWTQVFSASSDVVQSVAVDDLNPATAVFALAGQESPALVAVVNGTAQSISTTGLPQSAIDAVAIVQGVILVGLDEGGVYYSADFGNSWAQLGTGLPNAQVTDITVGAGYVVVGTFGRGAWALDVPALTEVQLNLSYGVTGGGTGYTAPALSYYSGGTVQQATLSTTPTAFTMDYAGIWNLTSPTLGGSGSSERWAAPSAPADPYVSGSYDYSVSFTHQYSVSFDYTVKGGGSGYSAPSVSYESFGYGENATIGQTYWADAGSAAEFQATLPGSGAQERWAAGPAPTISSAGTVTEAYGHQFYLQVTASQGGNVTPASGWFDAGSSVPLSATASQGWKFAGWNGTGSGSYGGSDATDSLTLNSPAQEVAVFEPGLTINAGGGGSVSYGTGSVSGGTQTVYVPLGSTVTLKAGPSLFYDFGSWSGTFTPTADPHAVTVEVNSPTSVGATFSLNGGAVAETAVGVLAALGAAFYLFRRFRAPRLPLPPPPPA